MGYLLKEMNRNERPRERALKLGVQMLSNNELLAILLRVGTKNYSAIDLANKLLNSFSSLDLLNEVTIKELEKIHGIGKTKAITILAAIELGKRVKEPSIPQYRIVNPLDTFRYLQQNMQHLTQESLVCLYLNTKSEVISMRTITIGTLNQTIFHPRDILKWGIKHSAAGIILAHNHPSGDPYPSANDIEATKKIVEAAKTIDIKIIDHIIIGKNKFFSFLENKKIFS